MAHKRGVSSRLADFWTRLVGIKRGFYHKIYTCCANATVNTTLSYASAKCHNINTNNFSFGKYTMKRHDWTETIKRNILFFKLVGFWPEGDAGYKMNFYTLYSISITIAFAFSHSFFQTFQLVRNLDDLDIVAGTAFLAISESLVVVKMFYLARNIQTFKKLLVTLNSDLFQPRSVEQILLVSPSVEVWKLMYKLLCGSITMVLIFLTLVPIVDKSYKRYRLPLIAWYPYDTKASPLYEITYLHQIISVFFLAISNINIDTLVAALSMYAGAQLDILCDNLKNLAPDHFEENLTKCVHHHREIVRFKLTIR
jgi:hypothetical protein